VTGIYKFHIDIFVKSVIILFSVLKSLLVDCISILKPILFLEYKNDFFETLKNLDKYRSENNFIVLDQNNYIGNSSMISCKKF